MVPDFLNVFLVRWFCFEKCPDSNFKFKQRWNNSKLIPKSHLLQRLDVFKTKQKNVGFFSKKTCIFSSAFLKQKGTSSIGTTYRLFLITEDQEPVQCLWVTRAFATDTGLLYSNSEQTVVPCRTEMLLGLEQESQPRADGKERRPLEKSGTAFQGAKGAKTQPNST